MAEQSAPTREEKLERKVNFAKERGTRVVLARMTDTHAIINIAKTTDRAMLLVRNNLGTGIDFDQGIPLLQNHLDEITKFAGITDKFLSDAINILKISKKDREKAAKEEKLVAN